MTKKELDKLKIGDKLWYRSSLDWLVRMETTLAIGSESNGPFKMRNRYGEFYDLDDRFMLKHYTIPTNMELILYG